MADFLQRQKHKTRRGSLCPSEYGACTADSAVPATERRNLMGQLDGKIAIVTGAAGGMGASHARVFVAEGAKVMITDVAEESGTKLAEELGENARFARHDVSSLEDWKRVVDETEQAFGDINVLVNNAGIVGPPANVVDLEEETYLKIIAINQHSMFYGMKTVIPSMLRADGGSIVNISSLAGLMVNQGVPNLAYPTSKFAVRGMTKAVAREYGRQGIRVNSVHPGAVLTDMAKATLGDNPEGFAPALLDRFAQPEEISDLVVFLASDKSAYITGAEHKIDGGWSAGQVG
jgi:3alpha(or 20beta)-hydroxysteroid dehydrogenase